MQNRTGKFDISIVEFEQVNIAVFQHRGPPALLGNSVRKFIEWRKKAGLSPDSSRTFNLLYDDRELTNPENYRIDLCAETKSTVAANDYGVAEKVIPAGRCAVYRHVGSDDGLEAAVNTLYVEWLDESGEELRDFPLFFERITFFPDVAEHEWVTDIYLPLL